MGRRFAASFPLPLLKEERREGRAPSLSREGLHASFEFDVKEIRRDTLTIDAEGQYTIEIPSALDDNSGVLVTIDISCPGFLTRQIGPYTIDQLDESRVESGDLNWNRIIPGTIRSALWMPRSTALRDR